MELPPSYRSILAFTLLASAGGCASWSRWSDDAPTSASARETVDNGAAGKSVFGKGRSPLRESARSIGLETRFEQIQIDPGVPDQLQSIWQWVDETAVPIDTRRRLHENGLRVGRVVQPDRLETRIAEFRAHRADDIVEQFLASAEVSSQQTEGRKINRLRLNERTELPVREPIEGQQVVLVRENEDLVGQTLIDPQFLFALTAEPTRSVSELRLRIRPEIQHGDVQHNWVTSDAAMRIDVRRPTWSLPFLEFELSGGEGDVFLIAETDPRRGLGESMFGGKNVDQMEEQTILVLRIDHLPLPSEIAAQ